MRLGLLLAVLLLGGCAGSRAPQPPAGHPGFDLWQYPGDDVMAAWRAASPYRWVGYYLPAPCHRDTSWAGTRPTLDRLGWGTAVLYVGQQAFESEPDSVAEDDGPILCSRTLLTAEQGGLDARDAVAKAVAEGFPTGTTLFLDIEKTSRLSDSLRTYYAAWTAAVLVDGRYRPGTYAHHENAAGLFGEALAAFRAAGRSDTPPFWAAGGSEFALDRAPSASGFSFATVWQGVLDAERTWGGVSLRVDENVAARPSPSAPRLDGRP